MKGFGRFISRVWWPINVQQRHLVSSLLCSCFAGYPGLSYIQSTDSVDVSQTGFIYSVTGQPTWTPLSILFFTVSIAILGRRSRSFSLIVVCAKRRRLSGDKNLREFCSFNDQRFRNVFLVSIWTDESQLQTSTRFFTGFKYTYINTGLSIKMKPTFGGHFEIFRESNYFICVHIWYI